MIQSSHRSDSITASSRRSSKSRLATSRFDTVSAFLLTLIWFVGTIVATLLVLWLLNRLTEPAIVVSEPIQRMTLVDSAKGSINAHFDVPLQDETNSQNQLSPDAAIQDVIDAASTIAADYADLATIGGNGTTAGSNVRQMPVDENGPTSILPRYQRWQLKFSAKSREHYAAQLDAFEIDLAAIGGEVKGLDVLSKLSKQIRSRHVDDASTENRLYFMWLSATELSRFEKEWFESVSIPTKNRQILKLIPIDLENELAVKELQHAQSAGYQAVNQIAKTVFDCRMVDGAYTFVIIGQRYR